MVKATLRSVFRTALCSAPKPPASNRTFVSSSRYEAYDEAYEAEKWEKIAKAGIATCTIYAIYILSTGHLHHEPPPPPPYPYMGIHKKDFPWGPEPLIERLKKKR